MNDDRWHWLLMLLRRIGLLLVTETEQQLGMESSVLSKQEREQRKREHERYEQKRATVFSAPANKGVLIN